MKQRVLITGASGFVGFHLVDAAVQAGLEVHAAVRKSSRVAHLDGYGLRYVYPDFDSMASLEEIIEKGQYHYIIHAAGLTKATTEEEYNKINAGYTQQLARAAGRSKALSKFVFMSSLAALGPVAYEAPCPILEDMEPRPVTGYGKSKLLAERYLQQLDAFPLVILRPTAVYGPRDKDIFLMIKLINSGLEPYIGRVQQRFSFIYAKDLARAAVSALTGNGSGAYNLSDGKVYDRYALANITKKLLRRHTFRLHIPYSLVRVLAGTLEKLGNGRKAPALNREKLNELTAPNWQCSIEKINRDLNFYPAYDLEKGLTETLAWYQTNGWL